MWNIRFRGVRLHRARKGCRQEYDQGGPPCALIKAVAAPGGRVAWEERGAGPSGRPFRAKGGLGAPRHRLHGSPRWAATSREEACAHQNGDK